MSESNKEIKVVLASGNAHKASEFQAMLEPFGFKIVLQSDFNVKDVDENGKSFIQNALIKAYNASEYANMPALADDSGICVDALGGAPGIMSARFCGEHGNDKNNNKLLLKKLEGIPMEKRSARFVCALAFVRSKDDPCPLIATASWEGKIGFEEMGSNGFGYDPLFVLESRNTTAALLPPQVKNLLSHRSKALHKMLDLLKSTYGY